MSLSPIARRVEREFKLPPPSGDVEDEISRDLEGLTEGILDYVGFKDVP